MSSWPRLVNSRLVRPAQPASTVIRCGVTDRMLAGTSVSGVFFFREALEAGALADALADALRQVPIFGGRLRDSDGKLEIICGGEGVPMVTYDVDETLGEAIARATMPGAGLADHVDALRGRGGEDPLLTVRVSRLSDGGTALGCSWHHAIGDMHSFMLLMRAWSAAMDGTEPPDVQIVEDPDAYLDQVLPREDSGRTGFRLLDPGQAAGLESEVQAAIRSGRTVQVYFSPAEVALMRQEFTAEAGQWLSASDALCGHVVATIRELDEDTEARSLAAPVNIRQRVGIPAAVTGNLVGEIFLSCAPRSQPAAIAAQVRAAVADFVRSELSIRTSMAFLAAAGPARLRDCVPIGFDPANRTFSFTNWTRLGLGDLTFGGQHPVLFSPAANLQVPWTALMTDGFDEAGQFLAICLPGKLAARLRSEDGRAAMHRFRDHGDPLPELAGAVRKLS